MRRSSTPGRATPWSADERGAIFAEYAVLLTLVSMTCVGAIVAVGVPLLNFYHDQVAILMLPVP